MHHQCHHKDRAHNESGNDVDAPDIAALLVAHRFFRPASVEAVLGGIGVPADATCLIQVTPPVDAGGIEALRIALGQRTEYLGVQIMVAEIRDPGPAIA